MKLNLDIKTPSSPDWINAVMSDFDSFLQDHADCERKASAMAMSFVAKYPDRSEIIPLLIETGIEELEHFEMVYKLMASRGVSLRQSMGEDIYMKKLIKKCHSGREERFKMVADHLEEGEMKKFYKMLWTSEAKHGHIFVGMALNYFEKDKVYDRLAWWVEQESEVIESLEIKPALH